MLKASLRASAMALFEPLPAASGPRRRKQAAGSIIPGHTLLIQPSARSAMPGYDSIVARRDEILAIMRVHGASNPRLFGSVARGDDKPYSDLDMLVDMEAGRSLVDLIGLQQALETRLGRRVDLLTPDSLNRHMRDRILAEARLL